METNARSRPAERVLRWLVRSCALTRRSHRIPVRGAREPSGVLLATPPAVDAGCRSFEALPAWLGGAPERLADRASAARSSPA